jgi:protein ImuB
MAAARCGIRATMGAAESRARCADLEERPWNDRTLTEAISEVSGRFLTASPQVMPVAGSPGTWWVGARGFEAIGGEMMLAEQLLQIAREWHPEARVAVADSCMAARVATWSPYREDRAVVRVPIGRCAAFLANVPLGLLPMEPPMREALAALGLKKIGELAALDPGDIERRFGRAGVHSWRLAHGDDPRRPGLVRTEARRSAGAELGMAATTSEPLLFVVRAAVERLVRELVSEGRAAASIALTLTLDAARGAMPDAGARAPTITREIRPARPLARTGPLFEQCRALLAEWVLPAPVIGVVVSIPATAPLSAEQGDLLVAAWRDQAQQLDAAFARVRAAFGPQAVVQPAVRDAHRPDQGGAWTVVTSAEETLERARPLSMATFDGPVLSRALRLLDGPEQVEIEQARGTPDAIWWRGARLSVAEAIGPERLSGSWWDAAPYARDYWRCRTTGDDSLPPPAGAAVLLYHDRQDGAWYLHGWYD